MTEHPPPSGGPPGQTPRPPPTPDDRPWAQRHPIILILLLLAGLGVAALASNGDDKNSSGNDTVQRKTNVTADASAELACTHLRNVAKDAGKGILTDDEFRDKIKEVYETASVSEDPEIRQNSQELLAAATQGDVDSFTASAQGMLQACQRLGV
jgi:hypothetical protein